MGALTATNAAPYGHQGAEGRIAFLAGSRPRVISHQFVEMYSRDRGWPSVYQPKRGAKHTAAAYSVGDAAATPTALATPTGTTMTPAPFRLVLAVTNYGLWRAIEENDPGKIANEEIKYACGIYLIADTTVGLRERYSAVTATGGNSGAALTVNGLTTAAHTVRGNLDDDGISVVSVIDGVGRANIVSDLGNNAAGYLASPAMTDRVLRTLSEHAFQDADSDGYLFSLDNLHHVYVEPSRNTLDQVSSNRVGCSFVPTLKSLSGKPVRDGQSLISPAFGMAVDKDPAPAFKLIDGTQRKDIMTPSGPVAVLTRAFDGADQVVFEGYGSGVTALMNDNSACQILYAAS